MPLFQFAFHLDDARINRGAFTTTRPFSDAVTRPVSEEHTAKDALHRNGRPGSFERSMIGRITHRNRATDHLYAGVRSTSSPTAATERIRTMPDDQHRVTGLRDSINRR